jgi:hypothetical protein
MYSGRRAFDLSRIMLLPGEVPFRMKTRRQREGCGTLRRIIQAEHGPGEGRPLVEIKNEYVRGKVIQK